MTVGELIEQLEQLDPDLEVMGYTEDIEREGTAQPFALDPSGIEEKNAKVMQSAGEGPCLKWSSGGEPMALIALIDQF